MSGSTIKIAVSPDVPHDIIDETFEGALIRRMVGVMRTKDGYELWSNAGVENAAVNLDELLELARESDSRFAKAAVPMLEKAIAEKEYLFLDEYGETLDIHQFDIVHVLQELCRMHPDRLTHFEVLWAEVTDTATPDFGRLGGGAEFVTADAIESVNAKRWLDDKRQALTNAIEARNNDPAGIWEKVEGRDVWRAALPHTDWHSVVANLPREFMQIEKIEITLNGKEYKFSDSRLAQPFLFATKEEAFKTSTEWFRKNASASRAKVFESMGLSPDEWTITEDEWFRVDRISPPGSEIWMSFDPDEGEWVLWDGEEVLGQEDEPQDLLKMLREAEAVFRN